MAQTFNQLCVWEGTMLGDSSVEDFEKFFKDSMNVTVKFAEEVVTNPDRNEYGDPVKDTGGRHDLLFYIADEDVTKFAIARLSMGIKWWEDVVTYNNRAYLYSQEILEKYPVKW